VIESARQTAVLLGRRRLFWTAAGVIALLGVSAHVVGGRAVERIDGRGMFCLLTWWLHSTVLLPWTTLFLGVQAVHGRIEDRTFQFLFLRPVGRIPLLLGNWLAVVLAAALVGVATHPDRWGDGIEWRLLTIFLEVSLLAALAYAAVAVFFGAWFRRPLVWSAFFVVGLQMLTANLPVSAGLRHLTITDPLRRLVLDRVEPGQSLARGLWPAERSFNPEMVGTPVQDLVLFTLVCLMLGLWAYSRTEYDSRSRE
jgi:hypothetical protein